MNWNLEYVFSPYSICVSNTLHGISVVDALVLNDIGETSITKAKDSLSLPSVERSIGCRQFVERQRKLTQEEGPFGAFGGQGVTDVLSDGSYYKTLSRIAKGKAYEYMYGPSSYDVNLSTGVF